MTNPQAPEIQLDPDERRTAPARRGAMLPIMAGTVLGLAAIAGWLWWSGQPVQVVATAPAPQPDAPAQPTAAPAPALHYPVMTAEGTAPLQAHEVPAALTQLLGHQAVTRFLQTDDFARRFVATVDNLGRAHAPPLLWPVLPVAGRFTVEERPDGSKVIAAANAERYQPFVSFVSSVDTEGAVQLYTRMYPLLQQAYRQLGFGDRYLNDRVVAVIDQLLATPEPAQPPQVRLTDVKGPIPSTRPWVRYEFVDPRIESLSAGQKILVRMGPVNERALKKKLAELRGQLVRAQPAAAR